MTAQHTVQQDAHTNRRIKIAIGPVKLHIAMAESRDKILLVAILPHQREIDSANIRRDSDSATHAKAL